jgi:hypothetical protein
MNRKGKMTLLEWVRKIDDDRYHLLGEYYEYLTGKKAETKDRQGFNRLYLQWAEENFTELMDQVKQVPDNIAVMRDWVPLSCIFQRKA